MYKILLTSSDDYSVLKSIAKECILIKKISPCAHIINNVRLRREKINHAYNGL